MPEYIERERVLGVISFLRNRFAFTALAAEHLETRIRAIPAAQVGGDVWHSTVEKPQEDGYYLVWTRNAGTEKCRWSERHQRWMGGAWTQHITHWMRAPPPP